LHIAYFVGVLIAENNPKYYKIRGLAQIFLHRLGHIPRTYIAPLGVAISSGLFIAAIELIVATPQR